MSEQRPHSWAVAGVLSTVDVPLGARRTAQPVLRERVRTLDSHSPVRHSLPYPHTVEGQRGDKVSLLPLSVLEPEPSGAVPTPMKAFVIFGGLAVMFLAGMPIESILAIVARSWIVRIARAGGGGRGSRGGRGGRRKSNGPTTFRQPYSREWYRRR